MIVNIPLTEDDHRSLLRQINFLMTIDDPEGDAELEQLALLVENFERKAFPIRHADPIDAIEFKMAQRNLAQADVARLTGIGRSHVSEILNGNRPLSLVAIRRFSEALGIPAQILIGPLQKVAVEQAMPVAAAFDD